jgi:hypothetical protein
MDRDISPDNVLLDLEDMTEGQGRGIMRDRGGKPVVVLGNFAMASNVGQGGLRQPQFFAQAHPV